MKVKNKSNKVISIGKIDVLPDKTTELTEVQAKNPVIKCFIDNGFLVEIPNDLKDEKKKTAKELAKVIKAMKEDEVLAKCAEFEIETEGKELKELKNLLLEAMV